MRSTTRTPRIAAILGAATLVTATLAGCSAVAGFGGCDPVYGSGDASSLVTATGKPGAISSVDFPTPLLVSTPEVSIIEHGDGALIEDGAQVDISVATFYGPDQQDLTGGQATRRVQAGLTGDASAINQALVCAHVGDRIALVATIEDSYGSGAAGDPSFDDDALVVIIDVTAAYLGKANGFNQLPLDGMPTAVTAVDGTPAVSVLLQEVPTSSRSSVIKGGGGTPVTEGDQVVAHVAVWTWPAEAGEKPAQVQSTWTDHSAGTYTLDASSSDTAGLPAGVIDALVGERIGAQVLVVLTPEDSGSEQTRIYVVDLLGIQK
ncbi:MAG: hypothetical protein KF727_12860 [Microbacteriaceae bacterium]|nr:hypothetical protein [Microbacteriaceae bacterium]